MNPQALIVCVDKPDENVIITLAGEFDRSSTTIWQESFDQACRSAAERVTIDLAALSFLDSSGVRVMLDARATAEQLGVQLQLANVPASVTRVFELTRVAGLFDLSKDARFSA